MHAIRKLWWRFGWERVGKLKMLWHWQERHILAVAGWIISPDLSFDLSLEFDPRHLGIGLRWQQFRGGGQHTLSISFDLWIDFFPTLSFHLRTTNAAPRPSAETVAS